MSTENKNGQEHQGHNFDGIRENPEGKPPVYFWVLFYGLIIWGVIFAAFYLLSGWSSESEFQSKMAEHQQKAMNAQALPSSKGEQTTDASSPQDLLAQGLKLYGSTCAMCHGAEGKGGIGPDLTRAVFTYGRTAEAVSVSISKGRSGGMPAYGNQFSADEINSLTTYVLSLKP